MEKKKLEREFNKKKQNLRGDVSGKEIIQKRKEINDEIIEAEKYGVPLLGQIPLVQAIRESGDEGHPAVMGDDITADAFRNLAEELARQVAIRNATLDKTKIVEIKTM